MTTMIKKSQALIITLDNSRDRPVEANRRRAKTRKALLEAAQSVFAVKQYETISIEDITSLADVAKGSFYNHFADKATLARDIAFLLHDHILNLVIKDTETHPDPAERCARGIMILLRFALENRESADAFFRLTRDLLSYKAPLTGLARALLEDGLRSKVFSHIGVADGTLLLVSVGQMAVQQAAEGEWDDRASGIAENFCAALLRAFGITPAKAKRITSLAAQDIFKDFKA